MNFTKDKTRVSAGQNFAVLVYAALAMALPCVVLCVTERTPWPAAVCAVLLPLSVYGWALSLARCVGRAVWAMFLFVFLAAFQLVLLCLYGRGIISVDMYLNLVTTNADEVGELLGRLLPAVALVVVVYVPLLVWATVLWVGRRALYRRGPAPIGVHHLRRFLGAAALTMAALTAVLQVAGRVNVADDVFPVNVCYNLGLAARRYVEAVRWPVTSAAYRYEARVAAPDSAAEVVVVVIGETARAANFSLCGYHRRTNPRLDAKDGVVAFSRAYTQSNTTHKSVPMLLTPLTPETFGELPRTRGLIAAFREAGFRTVFASNQRRNHSYIDHLGGEAHRTVFVKDHTRSDLVPDTCLLPEVDRALAAHRGRLLVVLHTYGSHFCYRDRYERDDARFTPDDRMEARAANRADLLNAYDNSLIATDRLLADVLARLRRDGRRSAMIYVSDHGENLFDDARGRFLHAGPSPTAHELHVPLIVWLSPRLAAVSPSLGRALRRNAPRRVQTGESVFHTALQLGGIATPLFDARCSVADTAYRCSAHTFLTDRNRAVPLASLLTDREDAAAR